MGLDLILLNFPLGCGLELKGGGGLPGPRVVCVSAPGGGGCLPGPGGVCLPGPGGCLLWGVSALGVSAPRGGCLLQGCLVWGGLPGPRGWHRSMH